MIDENGVETKTYEDGVKSEYDPATGKTNWYNENNEYQGTTSTDSDNVVTFTLPSKKSLRFSKGADSEKTYDEAGNLFSSTTHNAEDGTSTTDYYREGKVYRTKVKDKDGNVQKTIEYDSDGRIFRASEYDSEGRRVEFWYHEGQLNCTRVYAKDSNDWVDDYVDGRRATYDSSAMLQTWLDENGRTTAVTQYHADGGYVETKYDQDGNVYSTLISDKDGNGWTETCVDGSKRVYDHNAQTETVYDKDNNVVETTKFYENNSSTTVKADGSEVIYDGATGTTTHKDPAGRITQIDTIDENGNVCWTRYDADGKIVEECHHEGDVQITIFGDGSRTERNMQTGAFTEYNGDGEITSLYKPAAVVSSVDDGKGNVIDTLDDGGRIVHQEDGSSIQYNPDGIAILVSADGTRTFYYPNGFRYVCSADNGVRDIYYSTGIRISLDYTLHDGDGHDDGLEPIVEVERVVDETGTETVRYSDGSAVEYYTDGTIVDIRPDGAVFTTTYDSETGFNVVRDETGNIVSRYKYDNESGVGTVIDADGNKYVSKSDGSETRTYADGSSYVRDAEGNETWYDAGGNITDTRRPNPIVKTVYSEDGTRTETYKDGMRVVTRRDGCSTTYDKDGNVIDTYVPDRITNIAIDGNGNQIITFESGVKTEWRTDGTVATTDPVKGTVTVHDSEAGTTTVTDQKSGVTTVTDWASGKVTVVSEGNASGGGSGSSSVVQPDDFRDTTMPNVRTPEVPNSWRDNTDDSSSSSDHESGSDSDTSSTSNDSANTDANKKDAVQQPAVQKEAQEAARVAAEQVVSELTAIGNDASAYFGEDSAIIKDVQEIAGIAEGEDVVLSNVAPLSTEGIVAGEAVTLDLDTPLKPNSTVAILIGVPGPDGKIEWVAVQGAVDADGKVSFTLDDAAVARIASGNAIMAVASTPDAIA